MFIHEISAIDADMMCHICTFLFIWNCNVATYVCTYVGSYIITSYLYVQSVHGNNSGNKYS